MFRKRDFYALAFHSDKIKSIEDIHKMLPTKKLLFEPKSVDTLKNGTIEVQHFFYHTSHEFTTSGLLKHESVLTIWNGEECFKYNMFLMAFNYNEKIVGMVAVPFFPMAEEVFKHFEKAARGKGIKYHKVKIKELLEMRKALKAKKDNIINITGVSWAISGDLTARILSIRGENVPCSKTFNGLQSIKDQQGVDFEPDACQLVYTIDEDKKIKTIMNPYGNYVFYIGKEGRNLKKIRMLMEFLYENDFITETISFPKLYRNLFQGV